MPCEKQAYMVLSGLYVLHWEKGKRVFAPKTLTEMYTLFVISFVNWEVSNSTESINFLDVEHLTNLPPYIYSELLVLAKLAVDGIQEHKSIFEFVPQLQYLHGFLQKVGDIYMSDKKSSYSFLHLTVQEYFSGLYLSPNIPAVRNHLQVHE